MATDNPVSPRRKKGESAPIDWRAIERRLEDSRASTERVWAPSPEETKRILRERAAALARQPEPPPVADAHIEAVEFLLAYERYAIESPFVREVHPLENLTPLPCTPPFVLGIVNVRGEILPLVDIKKFFDLPEKGLTDLNKVIVLRSETMLVGILADAIVGTRRIPQADIQPSLPTLTEIRGDYLIGVTPERTVVLDAGKLLADPRILIEERVPG